MKKIIKVEIEIDLSEREKDEEGELGPQFFSIESVKVDGEEVEWEGRFEKIWRIYDDENGHDISLSEGNY